mgnify:CR=1 FL=1
MGQSPIHIEHDVEENRARVESPFDARKDRMSVGQIVDDISQFVGVQDMRGVMDTAGRQVHDNPLALGMIGLAWLALGGSSSFSGQAHASAYAHDDEDDLGASHAPRDGVAGKLRHAASDAADRAGHTGDGCGRQGVRRAGRHTRPCHRPWP